MAKKTKKINRQFFEANPSKGVDLKNNFLKRQIIQYIDVNGSSSITQLSKEIRTSVPKTTSLVEDLLLEKIIKDEGKTDSTGGRKAAVYGLAGSAFYFLGVDVRMNHIYIGLIDFAKQLLNQQKIAYTLQNTKASLAELVQLVNQFIQQQSIDRSEILSCVVAIGGRINHRSGQNYNAFNFLDGSLGTFVENSIRIPTTIENNSRAMAWGEMHVEKSLTDQHALFVNLDYGIGLGIVVDGKIYYGRSGFSGEFGHIPLFDNEIICHCGKKGCLETEASGWALIRNFKEHIEKGSSSSALKKNKSLNDATLEDIISASKNEDTLCIELLSEIGEKLGKGLAVLINIFNPELIILGGTLSETGDYIRLPARSVLNKFSLSLVNNDTSLRISRLGERSGVIGACLIARSKVIYNT